ncbi:putative bifunctional diguanylate cyclase/phosphodiesterase [Arthrobacter sulfonylureivorans]|uniref:putative bifunctional diguanylate cyclase/phosphodiesterase n=1 Tax=Arthrobacter sulfonylureivorans TaxID=2486855 RepID=UPI0039E67C9C
MTAAKAAAALSWAAIAGISAAGLLVLAQVVTASLVSPPRLGLVSVISVLVLVLAWHLRVDTPLMRRQTTAAMTAMVVVCNDLTAPLHHTVAVVGVGLLATRVVFRRFRWADLYWFISRLLAAAILVAVFQTAHAAGFIWPVALLAAWLAFFLTAIAVEGAFATSSKRRSTFRNGIGWPSALGTLVINLVLCVAGQHAAQQFHRDGVQAFFLVFASVLALAVTGWLRNRDLRRRLTGLVDASLELPWNPDGLDKTLLAAASSSVRADKVALQSEAPMDKEIGVRMRRWDDGDKYLVASRNGGAQFTEEDEQVLDALAHVGSIMVRHDELVHELRLQADTDALTGLGNRRTLWHRLAEINTGRSPGEAIAVVYLDLDEFKSVNDQHGHDVGDLLLTATAQRIRSEIRQEDVAARIGGDEFVVVLRDVGTEADARAAAERIAAAIARPLPARGSTLQVQASLGVAYSGSPAKDIEELLRSADACMYGAKRLQQRLRESERAGSGFETSLAAAVERGIRRHRLRVALQPIIALDLDSIVGFETLARYEDEELGTIPADQLVEEANRLGLLNELTIQVIDGAAAAMARVSEISDLRSISVNVELGQLVPGSTVVDRLRRMRAEGPELNIIIELTENSLDTMTEECRIMLAQLRSEGFRIAVDDFGSGYSSMNSLTEFAFDIVKVDRALVSGHDGSARNIVVSHLIAMFTALKADVVIEGIETAEAVEWLAGCPDLNVQGFYFGRPMWPDELIARLETSGKAARPESVRQSYPAMVD